MTDVGSGATAGGGKLKLTNDEAEALCVELAEIIIAHCKETGEQFHGITFASRGGLFVSNIVARCLGFRGQHLFNMGLGSYEDESTETSGQVDYGQLPDLAALAGKNWLHLDEIHDTGTTTDFAYEHHQKAGSALVRFGVLHYKPGRNTSVHVPDWYVQETDQWVVYPWEVHEEKGCQTAEIVRASAELPMSPDARQQNGIA